MGEAYKNWPQIMPGVYQNPRLDKERHPLREYLKANDSKLDKLIRACESVAKVIPLSTRASPSAYLDNIDRNVGNSREGEDTMKELRIRVVTGFNEDGSAIVKRVGAYDELALADKVIRAVVESGRIAEFLPAGVTQPLPEKPPEQPPEAAKTCFGDYIEQWRTTYKTGLAKTTADLCKAKSNVLKRFFGELMVEDITADDIQRFITEHAKICKRKTVKEDLATLKEVLDSAVYDGLITANPAKDRRIKNTAEAGDGTAALTREQAADILAHIPTLADPTERCLIGLLAYTSCRREEILGLRWESVDFEKHLIYIRQAVVFVGRESHIKGTKTAQSERQFPMCEDLERILNGCKRGSGFIIAGADGSPISPKEYKALWKSLESHIELYGMTAINFRTTFCTLSIASGVDVKTTQTLMGHATPDMTLRVYAKQEQGQLDLALDRITGFISA